MMFQPYIPRIGSPRYFASAAMGSEGGVSGDISLQYPVGITVDLSLIPGSGVKDYFFSHPYDGSMERVLIGASGAVVLGSDYVFQVVQLREGVITTFGAERTFNSFAVDPVTLSTPGTLSSGPVFLRVTGVATAVTLYATAQVLTNEVR